MTTTEVKDPEQKVGTARPRLSKVASYRTYDADSGARRLADIVVSSFSLVLTSPLLLLVWCLIKVTSGSPVFYSQTRVGRNGHLFRIWKFRTMKRHSEPYGPELSHPCDKRVTATGKVIRRLHLDEFPQFWNVLKGDMTLISYRPERPFYVAKILKRFPEYSDLISSGRPGLTSKGVLDFGYASDIDALVERARIDCDYMAARTCMSDMKLISRTFTNILCGKGI